MKKVKTEDNSITFYNEEVEDHYHSKSGAREESFEKHAKALKIKKVVICGGSGAFLINSAKAAGADIFITGDVKYHDFFEHHGQMTIVDAGHYETEQFTKELIASLLKEKFPTFALLISKINTNPVHIL